MPQGANVVADSHRIEGFSDDADRAQFGQTRSLGGQDFGGEKHYGNVGDQRPVSHADQCGRPVESGHHHVQEYEIRPQLVCKIDRFSAGTGGMHLQSRSQRQRRLYDLANVGIVVNEQNGLQLSVEHDAAPQHAMDRRQTGTSHKLRSFGRLNLCATSQNWIFWVPHAPCSDP